MRSMVPGSFGFTATRLRGASVPEISSVDSTLPTVAFTTGTSTIVASGAVVSGAASAVVDDDPHAASEQGSAQDDGKTKNRKPGTIPTHDDALQREQGLPRFLLPGTCTTRTWW